MAVYGGPVLRLQPTLAFLADCDGAGDAMLV